MKVLNLQCSHQHDFEGWFASEDDFHQQLERGLLSCPLCGDAQVRKMLSAPRLNLGRTSEEPVARAGIDTTAHLQRDAAQLRLALVGKDSASGGFVPVRELRRLGLAPATAFAHLEYAGSHAAALEAVTSGNADVAALAADVYDAARPAGVVELWRSEPILPGPLLCRPAADVPCQQFTDWLLDAHNEAPAVMAALRAGWPEFGDAMVFVPAPTALLTPALLD